jgi:hypothetical protein
MMNLYIRTHVICHKVVLEKEVRITRMVFVETSRLEPAVFKPRATVNQLEICKILTKRLLTPRFPIGRILPLCGSP